MRPNTNQDDQVAAWRAVAALFIHGIGSIKRTVSFRPIDFHDMHYREIDRGSFSCTAIEPWFES